MLNPKCEYKLPHVTNFYEFEAKYAATSDERDTKHLAGQQTVGIFAIEAEKFAQLDSLVRYIHHGRSASDKDDTSCLVLLEDRHVW